MESFKTMKNLGRSEEMKATAATGATAEEDGVAIRRAVKGLHFGEWEEKAAAAPVIRDLVKAGTSRRRALAELGIVPPLVSMVVEAREDGCWRSAAEALVELSNGSFMNKVLIVEAGLLTKLPQLKASKDPSTKQELAPLLLSLSSLAKTQFPFNPHPILSVLLDILGADTLAADETILTSTAALYNLSTKLDNTKAIVSTGAVHILLKLCFHRKVAEGALAALGNLIVAEVGKAAIEDDPLVPQVFIEILAWEEETRCQELVAYMLMVMWRRSAEQRRRMEEAGIVPLLLQAALLGSNLVRQRALHMLQWFKEERNGNVGRGLSEPQVGGVGVLAEEGDMKQCRRDLRSMVKQSLDMNMKSILGRGNPKSSPSVLPC